MTTEQSVNDNLYLEIIDIVIEELFVDALTRIQTKKPDEAQGEAERIEAFGRELFKDGFMQGLSTGVTLAKDSERAANSVTN